VSPPSRPARRHDPDDFWSYPAPPEDTQAYADWCQMALTDGDPAWESADGDPEGYGDPGYREAGDYG
jgi:hypothetical protein